MIEENGNNLSGEQKQRLSIARALLRNPKVLILDEATSSIDATTEKEIMREMFFLENVTIIFIAHRLSALVNCSKIFVFENGSIVEQGNHEELLGKKNVYYKLWNV